MVEKIIITPNEVRGLGNITLKKDADDFTANECGIIQSEETINGVLENVFTLDPYYDYLFYDDCSIDKTSDYGSSIALRNSGTSTLAYNSNGYYTITNTKADAESFIPITALTGTTSDFILEFDSYIQGANGSSGFVIYNSTTSWEKLTDDGDITKRTWYGYNNGSFHETGYNASIVTNQKWMHHKYTMIGNIFTIEITYDGSVVWSHSEVMHLTRDSTTQYGIDSEWQNNTVTRYKNIKAETYTTTI